MIQKGLATLRGDVLGSVPESEHKEAEFQGQPRLYLTLAAKLSSVTVTQVGLVLKA